jgi:hypothetical protein
MPIRSILRPKRHCSRSRSGQLGLFWLVIRLPQKSESDGCGVGVLCEAVRTARFWEVRRLEHSRFARLMSSLAATAGSFSK